MCGVNACVVCMWVSVCVHMPCIDKVCQPVQYKHKEAISKMYLSHHVFHSFTHLSCIQTYPTNMC